MTNIDEVRAAWQPYVDGLQNWQDVVDGVSPQATGCGPVYELKNPINRPNESFAIADMRTLKVAEPHYHSNGETEIYIVVQGSGVTVVGHNEQKISKGSVVVIPSNTTHFTLPSSELVLAVINTPPFDRQNYIPITETNDAVQFDKAQFMRLNV